MTQPPKAGEEKVFPAQAGVIPASAMQITIPTSLSRASGGDPKAMNVLAMKDKSFPRKRG